MLSGIFVALITPFKNGALDLASFEKYVDYIASSGVSGIVVCGSTGESLSLSLDEKTKLIEIAAKVNSGRTKLFGGVIESSTARGVDIIKSCDNYVDGFLCICPYYIKPSQEQIYQHFLELSRHTEKDIMIYNNPGRVGISITLETFKKTAAIKNVVAVKECSSDLSRFTLWRQQVKDDFAFFTGNDDTAWGAMAMGAVGIVSTSASVAPNLYLKAFNAFKNKSWDEFCTARDELAPLHALMFNEPSPTPTKYALKKMGLITSEESRAPLTKISENLRSEVNLFLNSKLN